MSLVPILQKIPLFANLSAPELARIADVARERTYPKNSVILFEDDPGDALYVVVSGSVKVVLIGEDGREVILSLLKQGDFFGDMALIDDEPRSAHVIAMEDATMFVLRREDFHQCLREAPAIALGVLRTLSRRLREADEKIGGLILLDVNGRVARLLLRMADENDGVQIAPKVTHHTIAQMVGSSRETVSRTMRSMVEQGLLDVSRRAISLKNRPALEALAGGRS
jgi:CRP-like cAMP-binding protein